jgi:hypothetical protein
MKKQQTNEVKQLQKTAGILNEAIDVSWNPYDDDRTKQQLRNSAIKDVFRGLEQGDSITALRDDIIKVFPKYAKKLEAFAELEELLYDQFEALYMDIEDDDY